MKCRSCGAAIFWGLTERGKRIPLNAEPDNAKGNMVISFWTQIDEGKPGEVTNFHVRAAGTLLDAKQTRYLSHFVSCPEAKRWRR